eukprot:GCRY01004645.1.p1 GENE.GCRY01004645.1~~GCRY01004645.1.p1  ORF type:complete len:236 (+),score=29.39 GCRY01004645.1:227-934(+)
MSVTLVRHGETESNKQGLIVGNSESPLSAEGLIQADLLGKRMDAENIPYSQCFVSDLERTRSTFAGYFSYRSSLIPVYTPLAREIHCGVMEGKDFAPFKKVGGFGAWTRDDKFEGGESVNDVLRRALVVRGKAEAHWGEHEEPHTLIVTHGMFLKEFINSLRMWEKKIATVEDFMKKNIAISNIIPKNTSMFRFELLEDAVSGDRVLRCTRDNCIAHLDGRVVIDRFSGVDSVED